MNSKPRFPEDRPAALGELIHAQVRVAIETAVHEEQRPRFGLWSPEGYTHFVYTPVEGTSQFLRAA